jgi:hypothetical protein
MLAKSADIALPISFQELFMSTTRDLINRLRELPLEPFDVARRTAQTAPRL